MAYIAPRINGSGGLNVGFDNCAFKESEIEADHSLKVLISKLLFLFFMKVGDKALILFFIFFRHC